MLLNYAKSLFILVRSCEKDQTKMTTCLLFKFRVDHIIIQST